MAQGGLIGSGIKVAWATGSPHSWNKLEQVLDAAIPMATNQKLDSTVHNNTTDFKRNIPGLADVSDMTIKMLRDPSSSTSPNQNALFAQRASHARNWWRVEIPADPDKSVNSFEAYEFQGRVGAFKPSAPLAAIQTLEAIVVFDDSSFSRFEPAVSQLP